MGAVLAISFAYLSACLLGITEERGTMSWFGRPIFLIPLYVFPTLSIILMLLLATKTKLTSRTVEYQGILFSQY